MNIISNQLSLVFLEQIESVVVSQNMNTLFFKVLAAFVFIIEGLGLYVLLTPRYCQGATNPIVPLVRVPLFFTIATATGIGLILSRRWAAIIVAVFSAYLSIDTYRRSSGAATGLRIVGVSIAILFLVPTVAAVKHWYALKPGGKYYF